MWTNDQTKAFHVIIFSLRSIRLEIYVPRKKHSLNIAHIAVNQKLFVELEAHARLAIKPRRRYFP